MQGTIAERYKHLQKILSAVQVRLAKLQHECNHLAPSKTPKSNTGNYYDKDTYWYEFKCPDCGKFWIEDQ